MFWTYVTFYSIPSAPNVLSASMSIAVWPVAIVHPSVALIFHGRNPEKASAWTVVVFFSGNFSRGKPVYPSSRASKIQPKGDSQDFIQTFWMGDAMSWYHAKKTPECASKSWLKKSKSIFSALIFFVDWTNNSFSNALMVALHVITFAPDAPASWKRPKAWAHSSNRDTYSTPMSRWNFVRSTSWITVPRYQALLTGRDAAAQSDDVCLHAYPAWQHDFLMVFTAVLSTEAWRNWWFSSSPHLECCLICVFNHIIFPFLMVILAQDKHQNTMKATELRG